MATTVEDLIELKDQAVDLAYNVVETVLAVWSEPEEGGMRDLIEQARAVMERDRLYDAAEEDDTVCSIEAYEERIA